MLLIQLLATLYMTGVIWVVQVVHYPLFAAIDTRLFHAYHAKHVQRMGWVVGPMMLIELATAIGWLIWPTPGLGRAWAWVGLGLLGVVWAGTFGWSVPTHRRLAANHCPQLLARLVNTNWIRTFGWTARSGLLLTAAFYS